MKEEITIDILMVNNKNFTDKLPDELREEFSKLSNMAYELGKKDAK